MEEHPFFRKCVFCNMLTPVARQSNLYEDEQLFVIPDINPDADHHYLVITKEHLHTPKSLTQKHLPLVNRMVEVAMQVLEEKCFKDPPVDRTLKDFRMGFHWPPFHSINHLHMHVLYPWSTMPYLKRRVHFRPDSIGFVTTEWLLKRIATLPDNC